MHKVVRNYAPKVLRGQRKSPTSLVAGPTFKTGDQDSSNAKENEPNERKPTGIAATSRETWAAARLLREAQAGKREREGGPQAPTPPRSGALGTYGRTPDPYKNPRKMKRDNTPLTNEIYSRTHAVPVEFGTPLDPETVKDRARMEGRGFKAELGPEDKVGWSDDDCASSNTVQGHEGIATRYTVMTNAQRAEEQQRP